MSSRNKLVPEEKIVPQVRPKPASKPPTPRVESRHGTAMVERDAKGFSLGETASAGISVYLARNWGVMVDPRRRSILQSNVEALKAWESHPKPPRRAMAEAKKLEEEVEKIEKVVKKEAALVKKEVVKTERKVRKGAREAEEKLEDKAKRKKKPSPKKTNKKK